MDLPLGRENFRSGFEELHSTEGENSAPSISFDIEQGLSSQTPSKYIKSEPGTQASQVSAPQKETRGRRGEGTVEGSFQGPLIVLIEPAGDE